MSHTAHIAKNKRTLELRAHITRLIREFFWSQGFLEMETPLLLRLPGQEPYLSPMKVALHNERGEEYTGYLHTSPEYTLKKMLAAGFENIFYLCKVFRDHESFGGTHNPEFTMIEWYRANADMTAIMDDCEQLFEYILCHLERSPPKADGVESSGGNGDSDPDSRPNGCSAGRASTPRLGGSVGMTKKEDEVHTFERLHMRDAWETYAEVNLDDYLTKEKMFALCMKKGYSPNADEPYEDLFYRIFLNEIEPHLGKDRPTIVHHYPLPMAALCRVSPEDPRYVDRFELYVQGLELANCFGELTDPVEQRRRLEADRAQRRTLGKDVFDIDTEFVDAVGMMPPSAGIALGIDRLVQLFAGCQNIDDVLPLPASRLFENHEL